MDPNRSARSLSERLRAFSFSAELSDPARRMLASDARSVKLEKDRLVLNEGDLCDPIALVEQGEIRVFRASPEGREIALYHVRPGEACALAMCAALSGRPYPASAIISRSTYGLAIGADTFRALFRSESSVRKFAIELLSDRLAETMTLVSEVAFERMDRRLARLLLERTEHLGDASVPLTHSEIAAELGTVREVVTRLLESFAANRTVSLARSRITVNRPAALRALIASDR